MSLEERLQAIAWDKVRHAHGPATDAPAELVHLVSEDPEARDAASDWIFSVIINKGRVYSATPFVCAVLAELLCTPGVPWPSRLAVALGLALEGQSPAPEIPRAIRAVLQPQLPAFLQLLQTAEEPLRGALLYLVAHFPEDAPTIFPLLGEGRDADRARAALSAGAAASLLEHVQQEVARPEGSFGREEAQLLIAGLQRSRLLERVVRRCLQHGYADLALDGLDGLPPGVMARKGVLLRIQALAQLGRVDEARSLARDLAEGWLAPASGPQSCNQEFRRDEVLAALAVVTGPEVQPQIELVLAAPEPEMLAEEA